MKTSNDIALVDTNVLVYSLFRESKYHDASRSLLDLAQNGQKHLCTTPQNLAEFYAVVTNPRRVESPRTSAEALEMVGNYTSMSGLSLLQVPVDVINRWTELAGRHPVSGGAIFDVVLVATMLGNGVHRVYTFNRQDFEIFEEIEVLRP